MRSARGHCSPVTAGAVFTAVVVAFGSRLAWAQLGVRFEIEVEATVNAAGEVEAAAGGGAAGASGDPWWDAAVEAGSPPAASVPPHPNEQVNVRQAEARLAEVRRSRGTQILYRELSLVRASCPLLEPAVRVAIVRAGREAVAGQAAGRTPLVDGLETALEEALRRHAGEASAAAYGAEREARAARRQAAAIAVLVDAIDRDAFLDGSGRAALGQALAANWKAEWAVVASTPARQRASGVQLPGGVAEVAAAVLDEATVAAWRQRAEEAGR